MKFFLLKVVNGWIDRDTDRLIEKEGETDTWKDNSLF